jgi:hypothetical protein
MKFTLKHSKIEFIPEFLFVPGRKYKADIFIPVINCLIEYEGLVFKPNDKGTTGKSGHTTATGYSSNCEKYNLATLLGFRLLRYTAMNYKNMMNDVRTLIKLNSHLHIQVQDGAVASFERMPSKETLQVVNKMVDLAKKK